MAEENMQGQKQLKPKFVDEAKIPTHFVNVVNVRGGLEEFYLTFGTVLPIELRDIEALESIETVDAQPIFRCAVTKTVMKQIIDLMQNIYNQQEQQIDAFRQWQANESED